MEFCPKCGSIIMINDKNKAVCAKCNYKPKGRMKIQSSQKIQNREGIFVIKEKDLITHPKTEMKCPNCKHKEAYFWTMQTRASDESETKFYKCTKCSHSWRDYR